VGGKEEKKRGCPFGKRYKGGRGGVLGEQERGKKSQRYPNSNRPKSYEGNSDDALRVKKKGAKNRGDQSRDIFLKRLQGGLERGRVREKCWLKELKKKNKKKKSFLIIGGGGGGGGLKGGGWGGVGGGGGGGVGWGAQGAESGPSSDLQQEIGKKGKAKGN